MVKCESMVCHEISVGFLYWILSNGTVMRLNSAVKLQDMGVIFPKAPPLAGA